MAEYQGKVAPGGAKYEAILKDLREEKDASDKKFDAAIAAVEALVPKGVDLSDAFHEQVVIAARRVSKSKVRRSAKRAESKPMSDKEKVVYDLMSKSGVTIAQLSRRSKISKVHVYVIAAALVARGLVRRIRRGIYAKK